MIRAAIYDLDDLMVDSNPLHELAWEPLFKEYGVDFNSYPTSQKTHFIGRRIIDILIELKEYFQINADLDTMYKKRQDIFLKIVQDKIQMMPGLKNSLELFKKLNMKIALASSGSTKYIDLVLDKFDLKKYFDIVVAGDDVTKGKPDPEVYIKASDKLGVNPAECLVLEDATVGVHAAKQAGCKCIAIQSPNTPKQDHSKADLILGSLKEISEEILIKL